MLLATVYCQEMELSTTRQAMMPGISFRLESYTRVGVPAPMFQVQGVGSLKDLPRCGCPCPASTVVENVTICIQRLRVHTAVSYLSIEAVPRLLVGKTIRCNLETRRTHIEQSGMCFEATR